MTEIQAYLIKLVTEIDEICTENSIDYVLFGGSSLGIERNAGFLPWDDDLDLLMTQENYLKFVKVMKENPREGRVLESPETNPEFPLHFGKYMSTETCGILRTLAYGNSSAGIWIDIFYLCPLSRDPKEAKNMLEWFQVYCEFQNRRYAECPNYVEGLVEKYKKALWMSRFFGYQKTLRWLEQKFNYVREEDCDQYFLHHALTPTIKIYSKRHMEHIVRRSFSGHMLPFSATNPELCREAYGDNWMMIPDIVAQDTHNAIFDTSVPYPVYQNDYLQMLDKDKIDKDMLFYKKTELMYKHDLYKPTQSVVKLHAMIDGEEQNNKLVDSEVIKLANEHRWDRLNQLFAEYSQIVNNDIYPRYNCFPELDNTKAGIYLEMLIRYNGGWSKAGKLLKFFHIPKETEEHLLSLINTCRAVAVARFDLRDDEKLKTAVTEFRSQDSDYCREVDMAVLDLACRRQDHDAIQKLLAKYHSFYGETEEIFLATAILQKKNGDPAVRETIDRLMETGRNGVLLLDVRRGAYEL